MLYLKSIALENLVLIGLFLLPNLLSSPNISAVVLAEWFGSLDGLMGHMCSKSVAHRPSPRYLSVSFSLGMNL